MNKGTKMDYIDLKILLPSEIFIQAKITKLIAEAENGSFCILPRHVDFVASLVPGILSYTEYKKDKEMFVAIDEGVLVKCGDEVLVSVRRAVIGPELGSLKTTIEKEFSILNEREKSARSASFKLEADLVRRYMELKEHG